MSVPRPLVALFRAAALFTLLAVLGGSVVAATHSGFECGNWPGCNADALLPTGPINELLFRNPWIEMGHRASAILAGPAALASALLVLRVRDAHPLAKILPWVTVAGAIVAGVVGRGIVLGVAYPAWVSAADLGSALVALTAMITACVALERTPTRAAWTPAARYAWAAAGTLLVMHLCSLYAAGPKSFTRVVSWPTWRLLDADVQGDLVLQWVRFPLAAAATVLAALAIRAALRAGARREAALAASLLAVVLALSVVIGLSGTDALGVPFAASAVFTYAALVLLGARSGLETRPSHEPATPLSVEAGSAARP